MLVKQEKKIFDYDKIYALLENISSRSLNISQGGGWWSQQEKNELVTSISAILSDCCVDREEGDPMLYSYANELETILKQSYTENSQYDFKQGIYNLRTKEYQRELVAKIFKTLTAMANSGKGAVGYVLIGVADNKCDADKIDNVYGTDIIKIDSFYITGVNGEVNEYYNGDFNKYFMVIRNALETMPINEHYKRQIGSKMRLVKYKNNGVIILRIKNDDGPVAFDNAFYTRSGASNDPVPVSMEEMQSFIKRFN